MKILGINEGNGASACLLIDGKIIAAANEERFTRLKHESGYPENSINFCLNYDNVKPEELDAVVIATIELDPVALLAKKVSNFKISDYVAENKEFWKPCLIEGKNVNYYYDFIKKHPELQHQDDLPYDFSFLEKSDPKDWVELFKEARLKCVTKKLGIPADKVHFINHHEGHAAYAYYATPFRDDILVLTADGWGDKANASINHGDKNNLIFGKQISSNNLARLYSWCTLLLGMKPHDHEYKVMGLAPYAKEYVLKKPFEVYASTLIVDGDEFKWNIKPKDMYFWFKEKLEDCRFDGIAAGLQKFTEERVAEWVKNIISKTKHSKVTYSGGLSLNIKATKRLMEMPEIELITVPASGGDDSLSIGCAYHYVAQLCEKNNINKSTIKPLNDVYLGPEFSNEQIKKAVKEKGAKYEMREGVTNKEVARLIADGNVIARCTGRMEFGVRALGNRSILADPREPEIVRIINEMIKGRDFWMPFTPSIKKERADDYLVNPKNIHSAFMTLSFDSTDLGKKDLKAAIHAYDKTVRPQMVEKEVNPDYHDLISEFEKLTGVGAFLNTSLNLHGDPIVCSPEDAMHLLDNSGLKMLFMNDILVIKKEN